MSSELGPEEDNSEGLLERAETLGGEPIKVEASSSPPGSPAQQSSASSQPVKLELPVKLLRLDASMQITQYDAEDEEEEEEEEVPNEQLPTPASDLNFDLPQRSVSLPDSFSHDAWLSPFGDLSGAWSPWLGLKPGLHPLMESFEVPESSSVEGVVSSSQGSAVHGTGRCRPCAWFWKPGSCQNQDNCSYCHLCPEGELKARKKAKVQLMRLGVVTPKAKGPSDAEVSGSPSVLKLSSLL